MESSYLIFQLIIWLSRIHVESYLELAHPPIVFKLALFFLWLELHIKIRSDNFIPINFAILVEVIYSIQYSLLDLTQCDLLVVVALLRKHPEIIICVKVVKVYSDVEVFRVFVHVKIIIMKFFLV